MKDYMSAYVGEVHKNGKPHLAVIEQDPGFAVVVWRQHKEGDEVIWSGWFYADEAMHLIYPDGVDVKYMLVEATPVEPAHVSQSYGGGVFESYKGVNLEEFKNFPLSRAQIMAMIDYRINPRKTLGFAIVKRHIHDGYDDMVRRVPGVMQNETTVRIEEMICPVLEFHNSNYSAIVVTPDGKMQEVDRGIVQVWI